MPRKKNYDQYKKEGKCTSCGHKKDRVGISCTKCLVLHNKASRKTKLNYISEGRCPRCGREVEDDGIQHCAKCTLRRAELLFNLYPNELGET